MELIVPVNLIYNHIMPEFKDWFTFHLVVSCLDGGFNVFLKRRSVSILGPLKRARYSEPACDVDRDSTELPSLIDDEKENDVAHLMKTMGRIIQHFHKVWELYSSTQQAPGLTFELPDIDPEYLQALCSEELSQNPTGSNI